MVSELVFSSSCYFHLPPWACDDLLVTTNAPLRLRFDLVHVPIVIGAEEVLWRSEEVVQGILRKRRCAWAEAGGLTT